MSRYTTICYFLHIVRLEDASFIWLISLCCSTRLFVVLSVHHLHLLPETLMCSIGTSGWRWELMVWKVCRGVRVTVRVWQLSHSNNWLTPRELRAGRWWRTSVLFCCYSIITSLHLVSVSILCYLSPARRVNREERQAVVSLSKPTLL